MDGSIRSQVTLETINRAGEIAELTLSPLADEPDDNPFETYGIPLEHSVVKVELNSEYSAKIDLTDVASELWYFLEEEFSKTNRGGGHFNELPKGWEIEELLGNDGHLGKHMLMQTLRAQTLRIRSESFNQEGESKGYTVTENEASILAVVGLIHDIGEIIHGDMRDGQKPDWYEKRVNQSGRDLVKAILGDDSESRLLPDWLIDLAFDIDLRERTDAVDYEKLGVDAEQFTRLCKLWRDSIEQVEYLESGLVAHVNTVKVARAGGITEEERNSLLLRMNAFSINIVARNMPPVLETAKQEAGTAAFLFRERDRSEFERKKIISSIIVRLSMRDDFSDILEKGETDPRVFDQARAIWQKETEAIG